MTITIRQMTKQDWDQVSAIYQEGIDTNNATFETEVPSQGQWFADHILECSIVAEEKSNILGWASLSKVSARCVYEGVGEVSVYVCKANQGRGIGNSLLAELIKLSEQQGFWTLQSSILAENEASINLHVKHGFRVVGRRERISKLNGDWRDLIVMERRSTVVGTD